MGNGRERPVLGIGEEARVSLPAYHCKKNFVDSKSFSWVGGAKE